jgi:hypothetical protein
MGDDQLADHQGRPDLDRGKAVIRNVGFSTTYDQANLRQVTNSGAQLPASGEVRLIDTRSLASSLQCGFEMIRAHRRPRRPSPAGRKILFHVEAGITIAEDRASVAQ